MKRLASFICVLLALTSARVDAQCAGCPTVNAQINTGPTVYICAGQSVALTASATPVLGAITTAYTLTSIPYNGQPFGGGQIGVSGCDDCWGSFQNLPFNFCFYGQTFNGFVQGSNGVLTFDPTAAGYCPWPISAPWPNIVQIARPYDIGAPWRDVNMAAGGNQGRWSVIGTAPTRTAVIQWDNIPYYSCGFIGGLGMRVQIHLMESTSVVEVHILRSNSCVGWNQGAGIVGIQNNIPTGVIPAGRNFPGAWSAVNEGWRWTPAPAIPNWTWTAPGGSVVSNGTMAVVSPTATGVYSAACIPGCAPGTVQVVVRTSPTITPSNNSPVCQGATINFTAAGGGTNTSYVWTGPMSYTSNVQNPVIANAQPSMSGVYTVIATNNFTPGPNCIGPPAFTTVGVVPVSQVSTTPTFTLCQGAQLNLTSVSGATPTSIAWSGPNAYTANIANPSINPVNPTNHQGDYLVTYSYAVQGITLVCTSTAVTNVSVVATSPVTITLPNNICQHQTAMMSATSNPMAPGWSWTGPNNFTSTLSAFSIPDIDPSYSGIYNVTATWAIGTKSCTISNFNQMNVVPVNPIAVNAPTAVCYPANVQLTANSPAAVGYSWSATTGFTSNIPSPLMGSPGTTATGVYTVTTAYTNGALMCYNTNTTSVTVNPIIPFTLDPYKQLCFGATYTISGPPGATSYLWTGPSTFTSGQQVLYIPSLQQMFAGTYSLEVTLGPCKTYGSTKVDVLTPISWTNTPGNKVICKGDSVALVAGATGGSHNYAYTWNPQQWLGSPTGSIQYGHPGNTTIYNLQAYDIACPFYTIAASFTVTVNKAPEPQLGLTKFEACQPYCLHLNSNTNGQAAEISYDFGSGAVLQADDFDYCLDAPGTYNLKVRSVGKNGCTWVYEQPAPIIVNPLPISDFSTDPEQVTTTNNHATYWPTNQQGNVVSYLWTFSGAVGGSANDTSSLKNPMRTYDKEGNYPVMLISTTDKGCKDSILKVIEIRDEFAIYIPNTFTPNGDNLNDVFNVKGVSIKAEGFSMEIYDRWGTLVYSTKDVSKGWDGTVKGLNAENGVYVYKVKAMAANGEGKKEYVGHVSLLK